MESWAIVFLGIIALASFVQVAFFLTLAVVGFMVARRLMRLQERAAAELREPRQHATEALRHVKDISAIVAEEARTIRAGAHAAATEVREAKEDVRRVIRMPWVEMAAVVKGVARAVSVIRETPWTPPGNGGAVRTPPPAGL
jgi:ABC-type multidrug transport system fused ATPase/permease subunit